MAEPAPELNPAQRREAPDRDNSPVEDEMRREVRRERPWATIVGVCGSFFAFVLMVLAMQFFSAGGPTPPADEKTPQQKIKELEDADRQTLTTYGTVDQKKKVYRVPIDRAMELVAREGTGPRAAPDARTPAEKAKDQEPPKATQAKDQAKPQGQVPAPKAAGPVKPKA